MQKVATTYPEHARAVWALGMPLILSNLAQFAIHITDTVMLGWYDVTALAASTLAGTMFFVTFLVGAGFAQALTPMVAAASEAGDEVQVRRVTRMGLWLSIFYGLAVTIPFFWAEDILIAIGQDPDVSAMAHIYLQIVIWQMIPALIVMAMKSFLAALEHTSIILWGTIGTAIMNIFVNYALIFGNWGAPELGIRGAAIASLAVTLVTVAVLVIYTLRTLPQYQLFRNFWRSDTEIMARVFRLGWPIGLTSLAEGGLFSASAVMMGWIGAIELAAHGIAIQLASLTFMVHIGFSQAATVRAGRALGRMDETGLRTGGIAAIGMSAFFAMITSVIFLAFPETLVSLFIDPAEPERATLLRVGASLVMVAALFQLVDGAQVIALGLLRGVQDTTVPMVMATVSYWIIGLPVSYVLGFTLGYGAVGLWLGLVIGLLAAAILLLWRFWGRSVCIAPRAA
ncbi:MATE family efflux transporter [Yoonia sediminilitoris]|uniref:Multidrug-efflux transporter n=1 Tax=Yoonia sediminilitoris TaxID=1286148 RepID=A0A2T6KQB4_9RHOB|nr:MATE family efflux transporter [Yoonia sediminilitoris]PUB18754.1 MATE family multidrug resistance protein [Yoonia sediminilitoris]RCW98922.1 MATE family multidrug resistance protein [Yoonia sediminilitoris]